MHVSRITFMPIDFIRQFISLAKLHHVFHFWLEDIWISLQDHLAEDRVDFHHWIAKEKKLCIVLATRMFLQVGNLTCQLAEFCFCRNIAETVCFCCLPTCRNTFASAGCEYVNLQKDFCFCRLWICHQNFFCHKKDFYFSPYGWFENFHKLNYWNSNSMWCLFYGLNFEQKLTVVWVCGENKLLNDVRSSVLGSLPCYLKKILEDSP